MSPSSESLLTAALSLPQEEREEMVDRLLRSLPSVAPERQAEIDRSWSEEAERRFQAYKAGSIQGVPYEEAMRAIRERLNR